MWESVLLDRKSFFSERERIATPVRGLARNDRF